MGYTHLPTINSFYTIKIETKININLSLKTINLLFIEQNAYEFIWRYPCLSE